MQHDWCNLGSFGNEISAAMWVFWVHDSCDVGLGTVLLLDWCHVGPVAAMWGFVLLHDWCHVGSVAAT